MRTKRWRPGVVLKAKPRRDGVNFVNHRYRPHVVLSDWTCVPLTAGQCVEQHLFPSPTNGLWKPCDLIVTYRCIPKIGYHYNVLGCLSESELLLAESIASKNPAKIFLDLRS